jgi:hypothetical protein
MKDARRAVVAFLGIVAATAVAFIISIASGRRTSPWHDGWFIFWVVLLVTVAVLAVAAAVPDFAEWLSGELRSVHRRRPPRDQHPVTDRWQYVSDGARAPSAMNATEIVLPGTGYRQQPGDRLPWVRIVVLIPCSQIGSDADAALLWSQFQKFLLKQQPVTSLVNSLTRAVPGVVWKRWFSTSTGILDAVLTPEKEEEAVAAARLELPDGTSRHFRDQRCALLILHFESSQKDGTAMPSAGPVAWTDHMLRALELPQALAGFLTGSLGLSSSAEPPVVLGFRLEAQHDLAELIDITGLNQLQGGRHKAQAIGYFIADRHGTPAANVVNRMIGDVLRYALAAER